MVTRIGIALFALASICFGGEPAAEEQWKAHIDRADVLLKHRDEAVTDEEIRAADAEYARAVEVARKAGLDELTIKALKYRVDCMVAIPDWVGLRDVEYEILEAQEGLGEKGARAAAITRQDLGYIESLLSNRDAALNHLYLAEEYFAAENIPDELAQTRLRLAAVHKDDTDLGLALAYAEHAWARFVKVDDRWSQAECLAILASLYGGLDEHDRSLDCLRKIREVDPDGEAMPPGWLDYDYARHYARAGDLDRTAGHLEKALRWFRRESDVVLVAHVLLDLALVEQWLGKPERALKRVDEALELKTLRRVLEVRALEQLGDILLETGKVGPAADAWRKAVALSRDGCDYEPAVMCETGLARISLQQGKPAKALEHAERALAAVATRPNRKSTVTAVQTRAEFSEVCDVALRAAFALEDPERIFATIERTRAGVLLNGVGGDGPLLDGDMPVKLHRRLAKAREGLAVARLEHDRLVGKGGAGERKRARQALEGIRNAQQEFRLALEPLLRKSPAALLTNREPIRDLATVQKSLGDDQALVLYAQVGETLRALVVTKAEARAVDLGPLERLESQVEVVRKAVVADAAEVDASKLRRTLLEGLSLPKGCRRLLVSPVGAVASAPFALLDPDREVAFIPSTSSWAALAERDCAPGSAMLAMADPAYPDAHIRRTGVVYRGRILDPLPGSREEVKAASRDGDVVLLGVSATESEFRRRLKEKDRWRAIHLACHGLVNRRRPVWSALALTPERGEDGYLTVLEVYGMKIPADLVVLSACDSGLGEYVRGEGQLGLPAAFMYAGSRSVLASLWRVSDQATQVFMREFHRAWRARPGQPAVSAADALEHARGAVRKAGFDHPRHWAAWVLWGAFD